MSIAYDRRCGRMRVVVNDNGAKDHAYGYGAQVEGMDGWNDASRAVYFNCSVEELRDLRHLIDRAIAAAESS